MAIPVQCACGQKFNAKDELAGKRGKCPACGQPLTVPAPLTLAPLDEPTPTFTRACPKCQADLQSNAVLCVNCGLDLRTGKQMRVSKSKESQDDDSEIPEMQPATPWGFWLPLAGGAIAAVLLAGIVGYFLFAGGSGGSLEVAKAKKGQPAVTPIGKGTPVAVVPAPAIDPMVPPNIPKAEYSVEKKPIEAKVEPVSPAEPITVKKILARVSSITQENVNGYEKFLRERTTLNALIYLGTLPNTKTEVAEAIQIGEAKPAVAALIKLVQEKRNAVDKKEILICSLGIDALGDFGSHATEAIPILSELIVAQEVAFVLSSKRALAKIQGKESPLPNTGTPPPPRRPEGITVQNSNFLDTMEFRARINPLGGEQYFPVAAAEGRRLLWTELKLAKLGVTNVDLTRLNVRDAAGNSHPLAALKYGPVSSQAARLQVSHLLRKEGLKGQVLLTFTSGRKSTEYATIRVDLSPETFVADIRSGHLFLTLVFVVPANATGFTIREFGGNEIPVGTVGRP